MYKHFKLNISISIFIILLLSSFTYIDKKGGEQVKDKNVNSVSVTNSTTTNTTSVNPKLSIKKSYVETLRKSLYRPQDSNVNGTAILGGILIFVGLIVFLFASILIGSLLMLVGLILALGSLGSNNKGVEKTKSKKEEVLEDVVYLKNGSIIRGIIMEQIPNVSIRIQTENKSLFVYKMDEVLKITKEPKQ